MRLFPIDFFQMQSLPMPTCNLLQAWAWLGAQDLDVLDGPTKGRPLRPGRSLSSKGYTQDTPETPEPEAPAEAKAPKTREAKGAKYRDGLWAVLQHQDSERSSESEAWRELGATKCHEVPGCWKFVGVILG